MFNSPKFFTQYACLFLCILFTGYATAQVQSPNQISVQGQGQVQISPDGLSFTVTVFEQGPLASKLNALVTDKTRKVIVSLQSESVKDSDIQSMALQLQPWVERENNQMVQKGFSVSRQIDVKLRSLQRFDVIMDKLLALGVNRIDSIQLLVENQHQLYLQALSNAMQDARNRAQVLAGAEGLKATKVLQVTEQGGFAPMRTLKMAEAFSAGPSMPGEVIVSASVSVTYELGN